MSEVSHVMKLLSPGDRKEGKKKDGKKDKKEKGYVQFEESDDSRSITDETKYEFPVHDTVKSFIFVFILFHVFRG